jgi:dTDP-4-dehydrorhamnose 3,5-epimerase-like enzyme
VSAPRLIPGNIAVDDRGELVFANDFNFDGVKRFYMVSNHQANFIRAWHAHKREAKYVMVVHGAALVGAVKIDDWNAPSRNLDVNRYVLSASQPRILYIPPGYANGFKTLSPGTKVLFFSTASLEESRDDDIRYEARYWDIWNVEER